MQSEGNFMVCNRKIIFIWKRLLRIIVNNHQTKIFEMVSFYGYKLLILYYVKLICWSIKERIKLFEHGNDFCNSRYYSNVMYYFSYRKEVGK